MAQTPRNNSGQSERRAGYLFGVPIGDLGWFTSLIMAVASGFVAFFASTFLAIVTILILNSAAGKQVDFTLSYRAIGLPLGLAVAFLALVYLGTLWMKRQLRRS
jgi:hypothetical protein